MKRKSPRIVVDNKMKWYGETDLNKGVVKINRRKARKSGSRGELLDTITHELLHVRYPRLSEKKIIKKTEAKTKRMSKKAKAKVYSKIKK